MRICPLLTAAIMLALFIVVSSAPLHAQTLPLPSNNPTQTAPRDDEDRVRIEKDMAKKANQERQAQLKRDTDNLLKLATELKQYVDKSNVNILSLDVVKKADEIEKLAHSVKEKMKAE
jgi:hypothetical protein